jgi:hypothetical protein
MPQRVRVAFFGSRTKRILMQAWPVAVTDEHGSFHTLAAGSSWETVEERRYTEAAAEARALISTL